MPDLSFNRTIEDVEKAIRDLAGTVLNQDSTRRAHPTYIGKTEIRTSYQRLIGALGLYSFLTEQSMHPQYWTPEFQYPTTKAIVDQAHAANNNL